MIDFNEFIENNKEEMYAILKELAVIPAPSGHEEKRAEYCLNVLKSFGAKDAYIDDALNVILPFNIEGKDNITVIGAHTDVVFGYDVPLNYVEKDGKIYFEGYMWKDFLSSKKRGHETVYEVVYDAEAQTITLTKVKN